MVGLLGSILCPHKVDVSFCWSTNIATSICMSHHKRNVADEFILAFPAVPHMSCSSYLDGLWNGRQVAVELLLYAMLLSGFVQNCTQHSYRHIFSFEKQIIQEKSPSALKTALIWCQNQLFLRIKWFWFVLAIISHVDSLQWVLGILTKTLYSIFNKMILQSNYWENIPVNRLCLTYFLHKISLYISKNIFDRTIGWWVVFATGPEDRVSIPGWLKKWYLMPPCLTLSIIR